jgi:hypothetical protein
MHHPYMTCNWQFHNKKQSTGNIGSTVLNSATTLLVYCLICSKDDDENRNVGCTHQRETRQMGKAIILYTNHATRYV